MGKRRISIQDLIRVKIPNDPQFSPDGVSVVFSVQTIDQEKNCYFSHLFKAIVDTGEVRQFTKGDVSDSKPCWSPAGKWIAFQRTRDKESQIWMISVQGGEARQLTNLKDGKIGSFGWSPDGRRIVFEFRPTHDDWTLAAYQQRKNNNLSRPPRVIDRLNYRRDSEGFLDLNQQIWVCDVECGDTRSIINDEWDAREPTWSPDGNSIAFISNRSDDDAKSFEEDLWIAAIDGGDLSKIPSPDGYKQGLAWSPNGEYLSYIGSETQNDPWGARNDRVWILPLADEQARCLTGYLDRIVENVSISDLRGIGNQKPTWMANSCGLFFLVSDQGNCHLYSVRLDAEPELVVGGSVDITGFSLRPSGEMLAILASTPDCPTEVFLTKNVNQQSLNHLQRLTNLNASLNRDVQLSLPEELWFSSFDEKKIQGWLLKPIDFDPENRYPFVLYIHGGPAAQYGNTFFHEFQVLAAQGYIVLYTNPRGSLGRDEAFATCIQGDWGNLDYKDLMCAIDTIEKLDYIDEERMAVLGGSYGGFMATWIVGQTNRFRCAITERGVSNRHSAVGTTDFSPMPDGYWAGNTWDQPEHLWAQSPLRFSGNIHTPLLIIHSEGDLRCPIGQAEQLFTALKRLNREVIFLRYPSETSHGFSRNGPPDLRLDRLRQITKWLDHYLK